MPKITRMSDAEQAKADELRRTFGAGMLTREQVGQELGLKHAAAGRWVKDVPHVMVNGRPKYQVSDVARKIIANRVEP